MSLSDYKITSWTQDVSSMPDRPSASGWTSAQVKAGFDSNSNQLKDAINGLIDDLEPAIEGDQAVFIAVYGETESADIEAAYQAGNVVLVKNGIQFGIMDLRNSATSHHFIIPHGNTYYNMICDSDTWSASSLQTLASIASPNFIGTPTAPTADSGTNTTQLATTAFVQTAAAGKVNKSGDTMTGALTLSGAPTSDLHASTKKYVDDGLSAKQYTLTFDDSPTEDSANPVKSGGVYDALGGKLDLAGGTMTGGLTLSGAPSNDLDAATKKYVDDRLSAKLSLSGGTMTGALTLSGAPTSDLHAATKKYVDDGLSAKQNTLTFDDSPTEDSANPVKSGGVYDALGGKQDAVSASGILKGDGDGGITAATAGTDYQAPLTAGTDYQTPLVAGTDYQTPLTAGTDYQTPLVAGTDYQTPLTAGTDYQTPLTAGTDYQTPLVAGTDYQTPLPSQSGNSGKFLTTNGSELSWGEAGGGGGGAGLPNQSGQAGKFLTTDGTDASWANVPDKVFIATYGTTTSAEIEAAYQAGNICLCPYNNIIYVLQHRSSATNHLFTAIYSSKYYRVTCSSNTWSNADAALAKLASPAFTGTPTAPTAASGTDTTQIATTAFVQGAVGGKAAKVTGGTQGNIAVLDSSGGIADGGISFSVVDGGLVVTYDD